MSDSVSTDKPSGRAARKRGRVSFASDDFAEGTSLRTLPDAGGSQRRIPLHQLAHNPRNPRYGYSDSETTELANSLREHGQLQAATAVARDVYLAHHPDDADALDDAPWVVLIGNRRLAAARIAQLPHLVVSIEDRLGGADPMLSEATLVENIHRQDLPPLLEAKELQGLLERHGSQTKVAQRVAKTQGWVSQRLSLLRLSDELQDQLRQGEITVKEARKVASFPPEEQQEGLLRLREEAGGRHSPSPKQGRADEDAQSEADSNGGTQSRAGGETTGPDVTRTAKRLRRQLSDDDFVALIEALQSLRP